MARDSESLFEVDTVHLRAQGNRMVGFGDALEVLGSSEPLGGQAQWGSPSLEAAGNRFAARYQYLVQGLAEQVDDCGTAMRGSASAYEEMDAIAAGAMNDLAGPW